jgi:hypothetical protein
MRDPHANDFLGGSANAINTILTEEANRIGADVHQRMMHTSPWIDLVKKSTFPEGMGYQLTTLIYDRSVPTTDEEGTAQGVRWDSVGGLNTAANAFGVSQTDQQLTDAADQVQGPNGPGNDAGAAGLATSGDRRNFVNFSKQLKAYSIERSIVESPRISVDDLRYAAHRQEQLRAVIDTLSEATRHIWEQRYRDEFDRLAGTFVVCKTTSSSFSTTVNSKPVEGQDTATIGGFNTGPADAGTESSINANISNALLDKIYFQLIRKGASQGAYGRENGRPVFGLVCSSEASNQLVTESEVFRDNLRYNNARVGELVAPLGVERSYRGFYHLVDDLAPRFKDAAGGAGLLERVEPYKVVKGVTSVDGDYDSAPYEVAYVIHPEVMESQIPAPFSGSNGLTFNPVNYSGDFKWSNILSETTNPDGTVGFFRGVLAAASKPIKTDFGYVVIFKRDAAAADVAKV